MRAADEAFSIQAGRGLGPHTILAAALRKSKLPIPARIGCFRASNSAKIVGDQDRDLLGIGKSASSAARSPPRFSIADRRPESNGHGLADSYLFHGLRWFWFDPSFSYGKRTQLLLQVRISRDKVPGRPRAAA